LPRRLSRVVLEMSLKPFKSLDQEAVEAVCREALRQWYPLTKLADTCSILFWVSDGSDILEWRGDLTDEFEWGRYIGFCNSKARPYTGHTTDPRRIAVPYSPEPTRFTYGDLQRIIATFKRIGRDGFGQKIMAGATFDCGPEFAESAFKFEKHPEIMSHGEEADIPGTHICMVRAWSRLHADPNPYAGFPEGIPEGTSFGRFLGRQCQSYLSTLGFDYVWFSNGFGYSSFGWSPFGEAFDGLNFNRIPYKELSERTLGFWRDFRAECSYPVEVRGTNFSVGIDLASDCAPALQLYEEGFVRCPPPNSPWGPLNNDFGIEMTGYLSRIAVLPAEDLPFRFYPNDPWFWQNPWWDLYNREPFDIYTPMSVSRINREGRAKGPDIIEFLTIDTEKGDLVEDCALEVIPHIRRALADGPDAPGLLTWLYPFREYHRIAAEHPHLVPAMYAGDWLMRDAINNGLPLNTVLSTDDLAGALASGALTDTILVTPSAVLPGTYEQLLCDWVKSGGRLLLYGPLATAPEVLRLLVGVNAAEGLEGDFTVRSVLSGDEYTHWRGERLLRHGPTLSGGPLCEVPDPAAANLKVLVQATSPQGTRAYAIHRTDPAWQGGSVVWVRGSSSWEMAKPGTRRDLPPLRFWNSGTLVRQALQAFGITLRQTLRTPQSPLTMVFVSRCNNGFYFTGVKTDTTGLVHLSLPDGAPILVQQEGILSGCSITYQLRKSYHENCVLFAAQPGESVVSCREQPPFPTGNTRRLTVSGLQDAEICIYPPRALLDRAAVSCAGKPVEAEKDQRRGCLRARGISGTLDLSW
jgi:hypothetical protein